MDPRFAEQRLLNEAGAAGAPESGEAQLRARGVGLASALRGLFHADPIVGVSRRGGRAGSMGGEAGGHVRSVKSRRPIMSMTRAPALIWNKVRTGHATETCARPLENMS